MTPWLRSNFITLTVLIWTGLITGIAVHAYFHPATHTVYDIYAPAARNWWAGRNLYIRGTDYFRYSPLVAISFTPFALLPDQWGGLLWKVFNSAIFALGLSSWARHILPANLSRTEEALLFLLVLPVALHSIYIGQANMLMLAAMLLGLAAAAQKRWNWAAGWLAWATLIKGYPLALALLLAWHYPKRFPARYAVALAVGLALPFAAQEPRVVAMQYSSWLSHLQDSASIMRERSRSIDYLLGTFGSPISPQVFTLMGVVTGALVFGWTMLGPWRKASDREKLKQMLTLFVTWLVLFAPAIEACTYAVMAPVIAWALLDSFRRRTGWAQHVALLVSLVLVGPAATDAFGPVFRHFASEHALQPVGALVFLGYLLSTTWQTWTRAPCAQFFLERRRPISL